MFLRSKPEKHGINISVIVCEMPNFTLESQQSTGKFLIRCSKNVLQRPETSEILNKVPMYQNLHLVSKMKRKVLYFSAICKVHFITLRDP